MRNVTIVLAVLAVVALTVPAYGDLWATWDVASGDFNTDANWQYGLTPYYPASTSPPHADSGKVQNGRTCTMSQSNDVQNWSIEAGHGELTGGDLYSRRGFAIGYQQYTYNSGTFTQTGGYVECAIYVGSASRGNGVYTISGGSIGNGTEGSTRSASLQVGCVPGLDDRNITGEFVIDESGTTTPGSIVVTKYSQAASTMTNPPAAPKLKVILSAVGYVTPIEVTGADWYQGMTLVSAADLEGVLSVDSSSYTNLGAEVITVDIVDVTGTGNLDYSGLALDAASIADGWTLGDDGSGTMQISNIPEPATMLLLGIGGIGVLIRRRRK